MTIHDRDKKTYVLNQIDGTYYSDDEDDFIDDEDDVDEDD
jgi:hypothetical protein